MAAGSGTCSRSSMHVTASKCAGCSHAKPPPTRPGSRAANPRLERVQASRRRGRPARDRCRARAHRHGPWPRTGSHRRSHVDERACSGEQTARSMYCKRSGLRSCNGLEGPCGPTSVARWRRTWRPPPHRHWKRRGLMWAPSSRCLPALSSEQRAPASRGA